MADPTPVVVGIHAVGLEPPGAQEHGLGQRGNRDRRAIPDRIGAECLDHQKGVFPLEVRSLIGAEPGDAVQHHAVHPCLVTSFEHPGIGTLGVRQLREGG